MTIKELHHDLTDNEPPIPAHLDERHGRLVVHFDQVPGGFANANVLHAAVDRLAGKYNDIFVYDQSPEHIVFRDK